MFFIFGSPRSGTTLLAQCLSQHDDVIVPNETDFIIPVAFILDRVQDPFLGKELIAKLICNSKAFNSSIGEYLHKDYINNIVFTSNYDLSDLLNNIYDELAAVNNCKIAGDKSPNDISSIYIIMKQEVFAKDNKIIHIVRDVRDVMSSLTKLGWIADQNAIFPRVWSNTNVNLTDLFKNIPQKYLLVKYEEFVCDYVHQLKRICAFLEIDYQEKMFDHRSRHPRYKDIDHHSGLFEPISDIKIGTYKNKLNPNTLARCQNLALEGLKTFGYELT